MSGYWSTYASKRMLSRRRTLGLGLGGLSMAILACGGDGEEEPSQPQNGASGTSPTESAASSSSYSYAPEGARKGGRLAAATAGVTNWNPVAVYTNATILAGAHVYDRLISSELGPERYKLEAAANVETPDELTVRFELKPAVFQNMPPVNGRTVTAEDVVASQMYVKNLTNAYDKSFQLNFIERIEAPDDKTVVIHLAKPDAYLFGSNHLGNSTAQAIIPAETLDGLDENPWIGSGPYQLANGIVSEEYQYKRFEQFRDAEHVFIDERHYLILTDPVALETALRGDQLHVGPNTYPTADRIAAETDGRFTLSEEDGVTFNALHFNMSKDYPWNDVRVREAIYRLTNRAQVLEAAIEGKGKLITGAMPVGVQQYQLDPSETEQYFRQDKAEAKKLLDAAGYDYDQEWELIPFGGVPGSLQETSVIVWSNQALDLGIKTRVNSSLPTSQLLSDVIANARFEIFFARAPGGNDPAYALRLFHTDSLSQYTHFGLHDSEIDAMIEKAEGLVDFEENIAFVKNLQHEILKRYGSPFGFFTDHYRVLYNSKLENYDTRPIPLPKYNTGVWWRED